MFTPFIADAPASTVSPASSSPTDNPSAPTFTMPHDAPPPPTGGSSQEPIRHMLFGTLSAVQTTIRLNYAEPNDWSQPISTGRPNEVMAILTKRVRLEH